MEIFLSLTLLLLLLCAVLAWRWRVDLGLNRAMAAGGARFLWTMPLLTTLWPHWQYLGQDGQFELQSLQVLIDDSPSMAEAEASVNNLVNSLETYCEQAACRLEVQRISDFNLQGESPLQAAFAAWQRGFPPSDNWLFFSDGGSTDPGQAWEARQGRGVILDYSPAEEVFNISISDLSSSLFAFAGQRLRLEFMLRRSGAKGNLKLPVQVWQGEKLLLSRQVKLMGNESAKKVEMTLPSARGLHFLTVKVLPVPGEAMYWDNTADLEVEVVTDTAAALHLLGQPSWDGRFLRRYLKGEPKYDLVSFFILRDPWDNYQVNPRDLSLIPFPVARLFGEELPRFSLVVMQNFNLSMFLKRQYQENVIKFVSGGGGLLFIGGPRALAAESGDYERLADIFPLQRRAGVSALPRFMPKAEFRLEFAQAKPQERSLATVYDEWQRILNLEDLPSFKGLYDFSEFDLRAQGVTPILQARLKDGQTQPLVLASYPGQGRALWLFSDHFWTLAFQQNPALSRTVYNSLLQAATYWLQGETIREHLEVRDLKLSRHSSGGVSFQALLQGHLLPYINRTWTWTLCGQQLNWEDLLWEDLGTFQRRVNGVVSLSAIAESSCSLTLQGHNHDVGAFKAQAWARLQPIWTDADIPFSKSQLLSLSKQSGAPVIQPRIKDLVGLFDLQPKIVQPQHKSRDFYWFLDNYLILFVFLSFLPIEVIIRRKDFIF